MGLEKALGWGLSGLGLERPVREGQSEFGFERISSGKARVE